MNGLGMRAKRRGVWRGNEAAMGGDMGGEGEGVRRGRARARGGSEGDGGSGGEGELRG